MKIITGYTGTDHVNAEDDAQLHRGAFGAGKYVLSDGSKLSYELLANNMIRIRDGGIMYNGVHALVENYEDVQIANGQQGITRTDVLVARHTKDELTGVASVGLVMITGSANAAAVPLDTDFPLYRIILSGVNVVAVDPLFNVLMPMEEIIEFVGDNLTIARAEMASMKTALQKEISTDSTKASNNLTNAMKSVSKEIAETEARMKEHCDTSNSNLTKSMENMKIELQSEMKAMNTNLQQQINDLKSILNDM